MASTYENATATEEPEAPETEAPEPQRPVALEAPLLLVTSDEAYGVCGADGVCE